MLQQQRLRQQQQLQQQQQIQQQQAQQQHQQQLQQQGRGPSPMAPQISGQHMQPPMQSSPPQMQQQHPQAQQQQQPEGQPGMLPGGLTPQQVMQVRMAQGASMSQNVGGPMGRQLPFTLQRGPNDPPLMKPSPEQLRTSQLLVQKWREEAIQKTSEIFLDLSISASLDN
jgi:type II secretory pathway pseudopilin PulG